MEIKREPADYNRDEVALAKRAFSRFRVNNTGICWVRSEDVEVGVQRCLTSAEGSKNISVNWALLRERIASADHNPADHAPCKTYFDSAAEARVRQLESYVFDQFGYTTCCDNVH